GAEEGDGQSADWFGSERQAGVVREDAREGAAEAPEHGRQYDAQASLRKRRQGARRGHQVLIRLRLIGRRKQGRHPQRRLALNTRRPTPPATRTRVPAPISKIFPELVGWRPSSMIRHFEKSVCG